MVARAAPFTPMQMCIRDSLYPESNIVAIDFDPGASEVNQLNRIKLMLSTANKNLKSQTAEESEQTEESA